MFCCWHPSSCFESVEQLTGGTAGIRCGQNDWTGVAWQLKGFASSVKETVPDSFQGLPCVVWSVIRTFRGAKDLGKAASVTTEFSGSCC